MRAADTKKKRHLGLFGDLKNKWLSAQQKRQLMDIIEESNLSIKDTCRILELNSDRYYRWRRQFNLEGIDGLKNNKSTPAKCPHSLLEEERKAIIDYAIKHPDVRHRKLAYMMQREDVVYVSPSTVYRVLKEEGLIPTRSYNKKRKADGKIEVKEPNKMWHLDITYIPVEQTHAYLISVLDGYSRYVVHAELSMSMTSDDIERVMSRAMFKENLYEKPVEQRSVLVTGNGTQIVSRSFQQFLREWEIEHIRTAVRHPESNGKIEVFHKTVKYENVYVKEKYQSFYEAKEDLEKFIQYYNHQRLHQGIGFVTPYEKHIGKAEQIINERKKKHEKAIERRKRLNRLFASKTA